MFRRRDKREDPDDSDVQADAPVEEAELDDADLGDAELGDQPEDMSADLDSQAADYMAGNDVWMYGPNAEDVLAILDRLEDIGPDSARPIVEAWQAMPKADRAQARKAVRKFTENDEELLRHYQLAREEVGTWMSVKSPFPEFVNAEPDWPRLCAQVGEAALDAATALILEDKLDEADYESLLDPWSEATAQLDGVADAASIDGGSGDDAADDDEEVSEEEEAEAEGKFGPNSDMLADFLNRLWLLTPEQIGRLVSGWQNTERDDLRTAHEAVRALVDEDPEWHDQVRRAQNELATWLNAGRIQESAGFLGQTGKNESRRMAGPTLADAVAALILGDLLEPADAETLYGPWFNLIGAPALPAAEEDEAPKAPVEAPAKAQRAPAKGPEPSPAPATKSRTTGKSTKK
jgi:hypothetical protein